MSKRGILEGYRTYDASESRGSATSWRGAFAARMGITEARERVGGDSPEEILGVMRGASWSEIKSAYRAAALRTHPDRAALNGMSIADATAAFKHILAAYTVLESRR